MLDDAPLMITKGMKPSHPVPVFSAQIVFREVGELTALDYHTHSIA